MHGQPTTLRQAGWTGSIELIGNERHLPYERPPLSKAALLAEDTPRPVIVFDEAVLADLGIVHHAGTEVVDIDRSRREVVLSTGGAHRIPPGVACDRGVAPTITVGGRFLPGTHAAYTSEDAFGCACAPACAQP